MALEPRTADLLPDDYQYHQERARQSLLTRKPGRFWARASLICAALALAVSPLLFGLMGVAAGTVAVVDGERWWGAAGVSASGGALIVSFYLVVGLAA